MTSDAHRDDNGVVNPWRRPLILAAKVVGTWLACFVIGYTFSFLGNTLGCRLDEAGVHSCVVIGLDIGEPLYFVSVAPLLLASFGIPLFIFALLGCLLWALWEYSIHLYRRHRD